METKSGAALSSPGVDGVSGGAGIDSPAPTPTHLATIEPELEHVLKKM